MWYNAGSHAAPVRSEDGLQIRCINCKSYTPSEAQLRLLSVTSALSGIICFRCDEEAWATIDGRIVSVDQARAAADDALFALLRARAESL